MNNNLPIYLKDMKTAIISIVNFIEGLNFEQFKLDDKTSSAIICKFQNYNNLDQDELLCITYRYNLKQVIIKYASFRSIKSI